MNRITGEPLIPPSVMEAMEEESLAAVTNTYHFWNRSIPLMRYQMNRMALDDRWNTILLILRHLPFDPLSQEYTSIYSYAMQLMRYFNMDDLIPANQLNASYYSHATIITSDIIERIRRNLTLSGDTIEISSDIHPIVIEHTYPWWNTHNYEDIESVMYDGRIDADRRLAIAYGAGVPISDEIIM